MAAGFPGLFDFDERLAELSAKGDDLERLNAVVDFEMFRSALEAAVPRADRSKGGRPPFDAVLMFKVLILQTMHSLSDERTEYLIKDRLSFMRFLGLSLSHGVPDANTIWTFREALKKANVVETLFARFDEALKPHQLTFARYEVLVLLTFSRAGQLPLKVIGSRLMVHPTSVTNAIERLVRAGYVERLPNPADGRGVLAAITDPGREVVEVATEALTAQDFGLADLPDAELDTVFELLRKVRLGAGDVAGD